MTWVKIGVNGGDAGIVVAAFMSSVLHSVLEEFSFNLSLYDCLFFSRSINYRDLL